MRTRKQRFRKSNRLASSHSFTSGSSSSVFERSGSEDASTLGSIFDGLEDIGVDGKQSITSGVGELQNLDLNFAGESLEQESHHPCGDDPGGGSEIGQEGAQSLLGDMSQLGAPLLCSLPTFKKAHKQTQPAEENGKPLKERKQNGRINGGTSSLRNKSLGKEKADATKTSKHETSIRSVSSSTRMKRFPRVGSGSSSSISRESVPSDREHELPLSMERLRATSPSPSSSSSFLTACDNKVNERYTPIAEPSATRRGTRQSKNSIKDDPRFVSASPASKNIKQRRKRRKIAKNATKQLVPTKPRARRPTKRGICGDDGKINEHGHSLLPKKSHSIDRPVNVSSKASSSSSSLSLSSSSFLPTTSKVAIHEAKRVKARTKRNVAAGAVSDFNDGGKDVPTGCLVKEPHTKRTQGGKTHLHDFRSVDLITRKQDKLANAAAVQAALLIQSNNKSRGKIKGRHEKGCPGQRQVSNTISSVTRSQRNKYHAKTNTDIIVGKKRRGRGRGAKNEISSNSKNKQGNSIVKSKKSNERKEERQKQKNQRNGYKAGELCDGGRVESTPRVHRTELSSFKIPRMSNTSTTTKLSEVGPSDLPGDKQQQHQRNMQAFQLPYPTSKEAVNSSVMKIHSIQHDKHGQQPKQQAKRTMMACKIGKGDVAVMSNQLESKDTLPFTPFTSASKKIKRKRKNEDNNGDTVGKGRKSLGKPSLVNAAKEGKNNDAPSSSKCWFCGETKRLSSPSEVLKRACPKLGPDTKVCWRHIEPLNDTWPEMIRLRDFHSPRGLPRSGIVPRFLHSSAKEAFARKILQNAYSKHYCWDTDNMQSRRRRSTSSKSSTNNGNNSNPPGDSQI
eukprot:jgi/Bigna1/78807/fgenesh1_pg.57_\